MAAASFQVAPQVTGSERPVAPAAADAPASTERPAWLKSQFKDGEQLASSYDNLLAEYTRLKQGVPSKDAPPADPAVEPKAEANGDPTVPPADADAAASATEKAKVEANAADALAAEGVDVDAMSARFWEAGELGADDRTILVAALSKSGFKDADKLIDSYTAAQKVAAAKSEEDIYAPLGGKVAAAPIIEWAQKNLTPGQKAALQPALDSGDVDQQVVAMNTILTLHTKANGSTPSRVLSGGGNTITMDAYGSMDEMVLDMGNPEYKTNPAYRMKVAQKAARSKL